MEASSQKTGEKQQSNLNTVLVIWEWLPEDVHYFVVPESKIGAVTRSLMDKNANCFLNSDKETVGLKRLYDAFYFNPKNKDDKAGKRPYKTDGRYRRYKSKNPPSGRTNIVAVYRFGFYL